MKLRAKTALLVAGTFAALVAALYFILAETFIRSFSELERAQAAEATERLRRALGQQMSDLQTFAGDWAIWNDSLAYVRGTNATFPEENITQDVLANARLAFMVFVGKDCDVVGRFPLEGFDIPAGLLEMIRPGSVLAPHVGVGAPPWPGGVAPRMVGILDLGEAGIFIVAANAMTDSSASEAPGGTFLAARRVGPDLADELSELMRHPVAIEAVNSGPRSAASRGAQRALGDGEGVHLEFSGETEMAGYFLAKDIFGKAALVFRMAMPRDVYQKGQATKRLFLYSLAGAGAVSLLVTILLLDASVINRLRRLSFGALQIGRSRDFSGRVEQEGSDEIADLGGSVNSMLGALQQAEGSVRAAGAEMERILNAVTDGLFLLDANLVIGPRYSKSAESIFMRADLGGAHFLRLMEAAVTPKTLAAAADYLAVLFDPNVKEKLIQTLNPLHEAEFNFPGEGGLFETKYLDFRFRRVVEAGAITAVMVSVADITKAVKLGRELAEAEERTNRQLDMMLSILHVDVEIVRDFLAGTREELAIIDSILREPVPEGLDDRAMSNHYRERLRRIQRLMHALKGNAGLLKLRFFENSAHMVENRLKKLAEKGAIGGQDFLGITLELAALHDHLTEAEAVIGRLLDVRAPRSGSAPGTQAGLHPMVASLDSLVRDLAERTGKMAALHAEHFAAEQIPFRFRKGSADILVQLARNSLRHGIEAPDLRRERLKPEEGRIDVWTGADDRHFIFGFRDDGGGLDSERIRQAAARLGIAAMEDTQGWSREQVLQLIFQPGFTTAEEATTEGGMGVGLDLVAERVASVQGIIRVESEPERFCQFWIWIPREAGPGAPAASTNGAGTAAVAEAATFSPGPATARV